MSCKKCDTSASVVPGTDFCLACLKAAMARVETSKTNGNEEKRWFLTDPKSLRKVAVDPALGNKLNTYQRDGVEFLWRNSFSDFNDSEKGDPLKIGGCILAHYMGLGKSLTTLTVLHTALTSRSMITKNEKTNKKKSLLHTVLLIAPANTLTNWVDEVNKWTSDLDKSLKILNLGTVTAGSRSKTIREWKSTGGILLLSDSAFLRAVDEIIVGGHPDVLVVDEAHTMLKQSANKGFKRLLDIQTKRRILLTGTPLQNNVSEYYRMVEYIRPGVIGVESEAEFERTFRFPIEKGLPKNASEEAKLESTRLLLKLKKNLEPYVDRKGRDVLLKQLPPIYDVLLELQPSPVQDRLIKLERRARNEDRKSRNFWSYYKDVAPMLNHPGSLKLVRAKRGQKMTWKSAEDAAGAWYMKSGISRPGISIQEFKNLQEPRSSPKLIILAHVIAMAIKNGDKILVYSQELKMLDIVEQFLGESDWKKQVSSLAEADSFKGIKLGGWEKGKNYFRIDGSVDSGRRGDLVDKFSSDENIRAFLISSLAGGIGINLCAASVVVIMDNHFNPTISNQCLSRAHRLGQMKTVYCFRLAMEGTMEAKIYARSVNKEGVAMQVVDGKPFERRFESGELDDLQDSNTIVTCQRCNKRRRLIEDEPPENGEWTCAMNSDPKFNSCKIPQQANLNKVLKGPMPIRNNPILKHIHGVVNKRTRLTPLVLDYIPVQIADEVNLCSEDKIITMEEEISEPPPAKKKTKKSLINGSSGNIKDKVIERDESTVKKIECRNEPVGSTGEVSLSTDGEEHKPKDTVAVKQEPIDLTIEPLDSTYEEPSSSKRDTKPKPKDVPIVNKSKKNPTRGNLTSKNPDIITISSDDEGYKIEKDIHTPCDKKVRSKAIRPKAAFPHHSNGGTQEFIMNGMVDYTMPDAPISTTNQQQNLLAFPPHLPVYGSAPYQGGIMPSAMLRGRQQQQQASMMQQQQYLRQLNGYNQQPQHPHFSQWL